MQIQELYYVLPENQRCLNIFTPIVKVGVERKLRSAIQQLPPPWRQWFVRWSHLCVKIDDFLWRRRYIEEEIASLKNITVENTMMIKHKLRLEEEADVEAMVGSFIGEALAAYGFQCWNMRYRTEIKQRNYLYETASYLIDSFWRGWSRSFEGVREKFEVFWDVGLESIFRLDLFEIRVISVTVVCCRNT